MWQDLVFGFGSLVFLTSMLSSLFNKNTKIPLATSVPTSVVLFLFTIAQGSLDLLFGASMNALNTLAWSAIAIWRH